MFPKYKFNLSDSNYNDWVRTHPYHYNSMREKPIYPITLIETNISSVRPFPNNWVSTKDEWTYFRDDRQFAKRTLFDANEVDQKIHLATLSSLTNQHLLDPEIKLPFEDDIFRAIGQKRVVKDKRNTLDEKSPGDKTYKIPEYSNDFYYKTNRNWRSERYQLPSKNGEHLSKDMMSLLNLDQSSSLFTGKNEIGYEPDRRLEKQEELSSVRNLSTWRPAPKLEVAFKVLDVGDKALKYRPKVTR